MKPAMDDLSVRARRGALTEAEDKQLLLLLASSQEARLAHRAGLDFDAEDTVLPGDDVLAQRIAERVLAARPRPLPPPRPWLKPLLALGAAGLVAALVFLATRRAPLTPPQTVTPRVAPSSIGVEPSAPPAASVVPEVIAGAVAPEAVPPASHAPNGNVPPHRDSLRGSSAGRATAAPSASRALAAEESASELFARANRARREGHGPEAIALYEQLQQRYPDSAESLSAEMALAMLKLKTNEAEAALHHFSAYLSRAPNGALAAEALWGQAQALSQLGRGDAAKQSLRLLLQRFPDSVYSGAARAKLEAAP